jgi:hypothetical protein
VQILKKLKPNRHSTHLRHGPPEKEQRAASWPRAGLRTPAEPRSTRFVPAGLNAALPRRHSNHFTAVHPSIPPGIDLLQSPSPRIPRPGPVPARQFLSRCARLNFSFESSGLSPLAKRGEAVSLTTRPSRVLTPGLVTVRPDRREHVSAVRPRPSPSSDGAELRQCPVFPGSRGDSQPFRDANWRCHKAEPA